MRRRLVLTHEAARHPFRRRFPPPQRQLSARGEGDKLREDDQDLKLFVLSFTAFFICFYSFIA